MPKRIKVRLLPKVHSLTMDGTRYKPGDVFDVPARLFRPDFMEKVEPAAKAKPAMTEEPTPPVETTEEPIEEEAAAEEKKK